LTVRLRTPIINRILINLVMVRLISS